MVAENLSKDLQGIDTVIVLVGASGTGKTTLMNAIYEKYGIPKLITTTTRKPRPNEVDGVDYYFVSKNEFLRRQQSNNFIEFTQYAGNFYGLEKEELETRKNNPSMIAMDLNGAININRLYPDRVVIIWMHNNFMSLIKNLVKRKESIKTIFKRLSFAFKNKEFRSPKKYFQTTHFLPLYSNEGVDTKTNLIYFSILQIGYVENSIYLKKLEKEKELDERKTLL